MYTFEMMPLAIALSVFLIGGPITLVVLIQGLNSWLGRFRARPVPTRLAAEKNAPLGLWINWDSERYPEKVCRIRIEFTELVRGGRSETLSFTFEDKKAKKKAFVLPLCLTPEQLDLFLDDGLDGDPRAVKKSLITVEIETVEGSSVKQKISKELFKKAMAFSDFSAEAEAIEVVEPALSDSWSVLTRVFPWRVATEEAQETKKAAGGPKAAGTAAPQIFDFIIKRVWIEPGCIVCDACENEAPDVFQVLADTCIVRENAPMGDTGSIVAAAEGCPVDVIKYDTAPKGA